MELLEYEAKEVFRGYGITTPDGGVATSPEEARRIAQEIGGAVAVKAQLPIGGRGKAGGVIFASTPRDAEESASKILGSTIRGVEVRKLLIERKLNIKDELYVGVTVDRRLGSYVVLASAEGGVDIEEVAAKNPEKIVKYPVNPLLGLRQHHGRFIAKKMGLSGQMMMALSDIIVRLYRLAFDKDAELAEINPLAVTDNGLVAVDARLNVDNNALYRHKDLERYSESELAGLSPREIEAQRLGISYVELDGNIGIVGNGAGLTMATLDTVKLFGGRPGDFLDLGGGASAERINKAVSFVLSDPRIDALFVNILGGITRCDDIARGVLDAKAKVDLDKPVIVRLVGTNEEEGRRILNDAGIVTFETMEEAAQKVVSTVGG